MFRAQNRFKQMIFFSSFTLSHELHSLQPDSSAWNTWQNMDCSYADLTPTPTFNKKNLAEK